MKLTGIAQAQVLRTTLGLAVRPFRDFLQLEDLDEYEGTKVSKISPPQWKTFLLVIALAVQTTISAAAFGVNLTAHRSRVCTVSFGLVTLSWVRVNVSLLPHSIILSS